MSTYDTHEILKAKSNGSFDVADVNIFDLDGMLINSSKAWPVPSVDISDRAYFRTLKSESRRHLVLIELLQSRTFRERLDSSDLAQDNRRKRGISGARDQRHRHSELREVLRTPGARRRRRHLMFHRDGTMLARFPHIEKLIGQNFSDGPFLQILENADHGSARETSGVDGQDRMGSVRQLSDFPIVIVATTTVSAALADWRAQTRLLTGVAGLLVLVIAMMLLLIVRQLSQQYETVEVQVVA